MKIPAFMYVESMVLKEIKDLEDLNPNDMDFGKAVRTVIRNLEEGKYNPPSDIEIENTNEQEKG